MTAALIAGDASPALPPLREELTLYAGPCSHGGVPRWTLHDPACNRFFRIGWPEFEILSRWRQGRSAEALARQVSAETTLSIEQDAVDALSKFLQANNLLQHRGTTAPKRLAEIKNRMRPSWAQKLLRNHLFIRLPLVRPDALLVPLQRLTGFAFTRGFLWVTILVAVLGLYLAARQWDTYVETFLHFFDWSGLALFALTLVVIKIFHELGHALTARRFGCRVPTMGLAFLVFWPVLYTDTTDAWKLASKRARLAISAAGVTVELVIAAYATLAWSFLPPGPLQSAAFLAATTTWVLSLVINLNPFMRFDGYFLLTDALNVHNLQERSFALAKWRLREALFGFGEA
ncbi:MAG: peptidase, partial [Proteobacteria bacterium]|nr:peptidase [Pseudomonadota bacterium]